MDAILPLALIVAAAVAHGGFPMAIRGAAPWGAAETWLVFAAVALVAAPVTVLLVAVPGTAASLAGIPVADLFPAIAGGMLWGLASIGYVVAVERLGASLGAGLFMGACVVAAVVFPILVTGRLPPPAAALWMAVGVAAALAGIAFAVTAGRIRQPGAGMTGRVGVLAAVGGGALGTAWTWGVLDGEALATIAGPGVPAQIPATAVALLAAAPVAAGWAMLRIRRGPRRAAPSPQRLAVLVLACVAWAAGLFATVVATGLLGPSGPAIGIALLVVVQAVLLGIAGWRLGEWRGHPRAARVQAGALALLALSALLMAAARSADAAPTPPPSLDHPRSAP